MDLMSMVVHTLADTYDTVPRTGTQLAFFLIWTAGFKFVVGAMPIWQSRSPSMAVSISAFCFGIRILPLFFEVGGGVGGGGWHLKSVSHRGVQIAFSWTLYTKSMKSMCSIGVLNLAQVCVITVSAHALIHNAWEHAFKWSCSNADSATQIMCD